LCEERGAAVGDEGEEEGAAGLVGAAIGGHGLE
jgi:hypothetical protein